MQGGRTPIHIQRWAPADYHADEHVRLLYARRDWRTLTFYRTFIDVAFMKGGDLPADPEALAASLMMPVHDVRTALAFCLDRLVFEEEGRLLQKRVRREVVAELEFRESQSYSGRRGGLARASRRAQGKTKASLPESRSEPQARRTPAPAPEPTPSPAPKERLPAPSVPAVALSWSQEACDDWKAHLGTPPGGRVGAALKPLVREHGWEKVRPLWREACEQAALETDPSYFTPEVFARTFKARMTTPRGRGKPTVQDKTAANLTAWIAAKEGA